MERRVSTSGVPEREPPAGIPGIGQLIADKYRVERVLGSGGMGVVLAARHVALGHRVAVKFLLPEAAARTDAVERFLREARAVVDLKSEHVVRVVDVGTLPGGSPYIIMEHLEGTDLSDVLAERGILPPAEAVGYVLQACEAIAEAHGRGIVHRDLKPSNVFLVDRGSGPPLLKVLDFGIAKSVQTSESPSLTATGSLMGSPRYMSPEQIRNTKAVDARSDVWSLGVILYELLSGEAPFDADTPQATIAAISADPVVPIRERCTGVPEELEAVILRCLEKDLTKRMPDVGTLARALQPFASSDASLSVARIDRALASVEFAATIKSPSKPAKAEIEARSGASDTISTWDAPAPPKSGRRILVAIAVALAGGVAVALFLSGGGGGAERAPVAEQPTGVAPAASLEVARPGAATVSTSQGVIVSPGAAATSEPAASAPTAAPVAATAAPTPTAGPRKTWVKSGPAAPPPPPPPPRATGPAKPAVDPLGDRR
jgi:eukaryotic-like serine/threonine-protein kinase